MMLPIQASPVMRSVSTAIISDMSLGINPSNWRLQCDLCCQAGGNSGQVDCSLVVPGCVCPVQ